MKLTGDELQALFNDTKNMMESVTEKERLIKRMKSGEIKDASSDELALYEELVFYMRGNLKMLKILCYHNGIKI